MDELHAETAAFTGSRGSAASLSSEEEEVEGEEEKHCRFHGALPALKLERGNPCSNLGRANIMALLPVLK